MYRRWGTAFTIVELLLVLTIIGMLALAVSTNYGSWQQQAASQSVKSDLLQAISSLQSHKNFKNSFPPNLAGTGFAGSPNVALTLQTNAPSVGVYENLSTAENAQLFLNTCNANIFSTPNNTACSFQGNNNGAKIHVAGTQGTNAIWPSPISESGVTLSCGANQTACDSALADMISQFTAQGGVFPIQVPNNSVSMPEPTLVPNGPANRFCLEARSIDYPEIIYFVTSENQQIAVGQCPNDPSLHYYQ